MNGDIHRVRNLVEAQIQTTTTDANNDKEETISAEANPRTDLMEVNQIVLESKVRESQAN